MKAFLKSGKQWKEEKNKLAILNAEEGNYIFADDIEDATRKINERSELHPNFEVCHSGPYYGHRVRKGSNHSAITEYDKPRMIQNVDPELGVRLIQRHKDVPVNFIWDMKRRFEEVLAKDLRAFGIVMRGHRFVHDPVSAQDSLDYEKKQQAYKPKLRKRFVRVYEIQEAAYGMKRAIAQTSTKLNEHMVVRVAWPFYYDKTKRTQCLKVLKYSSMMNEIFGKFSYRQIVQFQDLKKIWKKEKPKSHKSINVTPDFFDFMEHEVTRRKPKARKLKPKYKVLLSKGGLTGWGGE